MIQLFAKKLNVSPSSIEIITGHSQPRKILEIPGITQEDFQTRLNGIEG